MFWPTLKQCFCPAKTELFPSGSILKWHFRVLVWPLKMKVFQNDDTFLLVTHLRDKTMKASSKIR